MWEQRVQRLPRPSPLTVLLALLSAAGSVIHAVVCPEHFWEWLLFGVFFILVSCLQAAWSVLMLIRPSRTLLELAALGYEAVVGIFLLSRTYGIPFGPAPFRAEWLTVLGIVATVAELAVVAGASSALYVGRRNPLGRYSFMSGAQGTKGVLA